MPRWGWWIALLLSAYLIPPSGLAARGYFFGDWWQTVTRMPLGQWHWYDVFPLVCLYAVAGVLVRGVDKLLEQEIEPSRADKGESPQK
jgi:hypothetical protein